MIWVYFRENYLDTSFGISRFRQRFDNDEWSAIKLEMESLSSFLSDNIMLSPPHLRYQHRSNAGHANHIDHEIWTPRRSGVLQKLWEMLELCGHKYARIWMESDDNEAERSHNDVGDLWNEAHIENWGDTGSHSIQSYRHRVACVNHADDSEEFLMNFRTILHHQVRSDIRV